MNKAPFGASRTTFVSCLAVFAAAWILPVTQDDVWNQRFPELNELQLSAVNDLRVLDEESLLVVAPTSSGKTFIGELAAARAISEGRKAVFLLPFKALTNEKYEEFDELYGEGLGLRVLRCTGDYADSTELFIKGQYDVALLTYEMFLGLSLAAPPVLAKIGLVVLDEAQFITDPTRGIGVELLLTNLLAAREQGIKPQLVALSAVIGEVNHLDDWLGCQRLVTDARPVPLVEGVINRRGEYRYVDVDGQEGSEQLLAPQDIVQRRARPGSQDVIVPLVRKLVAKGEQVLVFRNNRGASAGCAGYLARELGLDEAAEALASLPGQDLSSTSGKLRTALLGGTAFHTSDLSREERAVVEQVFRDPQGPIRVLVATSTVAAGVNTPVETVIIVENAFPGRPAQDYTVAGYKNMAGRAGRLGLAEHGRSILLAADPLEEGMLFRRYVHGEPEQVRSSFDLGEIDTWVLRLLAQVPDVPRDRVATLLTNTYAGYLATRASPEWEPEMRGRVEAFLTRTLELGLLEQEGDIVRLSLLGKACGRSHLRLPSAMRLVQILRSMPPESLTATRLLAVIHSLPEFDEAYTPMFRRGRREYVWQDDVRARHGPEVLRALQNGARDAMAFHARCKRVAVLSAWTDGTAIGEMEQRFTVNPFFALGAGDIRGFADLARFHLAAAFDIADVLLAGAGPNADDADQLLIQLENGLPPSALGLLELPIALERGTYLAFHHSGVATAAAVWVLREEDVARLVGASAASRLNAVRPALVQIGDEPAAD